MTIRPLTSGRISMTSDSPPNTHSLPLRGAVLGVGAAMIALLLFGLAAGGGPNALLPRGVLGPLGWLLLMPGMVGAFAEVLEQRGTRAKSVKLCGVMADLVPPAEIARITRLLGAPYANTFGATETGCPPCSSSLIPVGLSPTSLAKAQSPFCEIRLVDSQLMGHSINSASFFASTNLLLIAAVAGVLFGGGEALRGVAALAVEGQPIPFLEGKLALVLLCLVRGFLDFIWSLRQMNYALALIGAAPEIHTDADRAALGQAAGDLLNPALSSFSQGVRGYYFALAAAAWLFGPAWLALGVVAAFALLVWRQAGSEAARALRSARRALEPPDRNS